MHDQKTDTDLREKVRATISDAYYEARNKGLGMETAADHATSGVLRILAGGQS